jgi:hypothetical protein
VFGRSGEHLRSPQLQTSYFATSGVRSFEFTFQGSQFSIEGIRVAGEPPITITAKYDGKTRTKTVPGVDTTVCFYTYYQSETFAFGSHIANISIDDALYFAFEAVQISEANATTTGNRSAPTDMNPFDSGRKSS